MFYILLVIILGGQQIELRDSREFSSLAACNTELAKFSGLGMSQPWAITCMSDVKA